MIRGPAFRMFGFTWRLSFEKEVKSWPGNAMLWLYLVSLPPKLSKVEVDFELQFEELNVKHQAICKDFVSSGYRWGWPKGKCLTENVMKLDASNGLTLRVKIQHLIAVYNKDGDDVTDSYLGSTPKQQKSVSMDTSSDFGQTIQTLTARVDSLTAAVEEIRNRLDEEQKDNDHALQQQMNEMKRTLQKLVSKEDDVEDNSEKGLFKKWVENTLKYPEYYEVLTENGIDSLKVAKLLTRSELKMIGITKVGHLLRIEAEIKALKDTDAKPPVPAYQEPVEGGTLMI